MTYFDYAGDSLYYGEYCPFRRTCPSREKRLVRIIDVYLGDGIWIGRP